MTPVVRVDGLGYAYPDGTEALAGVDLSIGAGERVALLGPNGAGKSTLALHLNGILRPRSGSVTVDGLAVVDANLVEVRRRVGQVFQDADTQLFLGTVGDDVAFGPANLGLGPVEIERRVTAALAATGATALRDRNPHHLSTGEKRRVALATVLAMDPVVLVMDEPTAGLDPAGRRELIGLLVGLEPALLIITHDLLFALEVCGRSVVLAGGRVRADGPTGRILADDALLADNRLELPRGIDRSLLEADRDGSLGWDG